MPGLTCSVASCKTNSTKSKKDGAQIRFFNFPNDPDMAKAWVKICKRTPDFKTKFNRVCSLHFKSSDYEDEIQAKILNYPPKKLKKDAFPSLNTTSEILQSGTPSDSATSDREKRYSKKLRKKVVEECLEEHKGKSKPINKKSKENVVVQNKENKTIDKSIKKKVPIKRIDKTRDESLMEEITVSIEEEYTQVSDKSKKKKVPIKKISKTENKTLKKKVTVPIEESNKICGENMEIELSALNQNHNKICSRNTEKEVSLCIQNENTVSDQNVEEVTVPIEENSEIGKKNIEEKVSAPNFGENNVIDQNTKVVLITVPIVTSVMQNPNEDCVCGSENCLKCQLRLLKQENQALRSKIQEHVQNEKKMNALTKKSLREKKSQFESKVKTAFQHFLTPNQVMQVLNKKLKVKWTEEDISKAFNIMQFSKPLYTYLKENLNYPLPSLSVVRKWIHETSLKLEKECSLLEMCPDLPVISENVPSDCPTQSENLLSHHPMDYETSDNNIPSENLPSDHAVGSENLKLVSEGCNKSPSSTDVQIDSENSLKKKKATVANKTFQFHLNHKNYFNKLILKRHRNVTKPRRFHCSICQKGFDMSGTLKRHLKTHVLDNPWTCDVCDEIFSSKFHLDKHIPTHKNADKFVCDICDQSFVKKINFQDHYLNHKNIQAQDVNKEQNTDQYVIEGTSNNVDQYVIEGTSSTADQYVIGGTSNNADQYVIEGTSNNAGQYVIEGPTNEQYEAVQFIVTNYCPQTTVKPYMCHICNVLFENKNDLKLHLVVCKAENKNRLRVVHRTKLEAKYFCQWCGKGFKYRPILERHLLKHKNGKMVIKKPKTVKKLGTKSKTMKVFECEYCHKQFLERNAFYRHKRLHDEEKSKVKFFCSVCNKGFRQQHYLNQHMQKHCEEKPHSETVKVYECVICDKRFNRPNALYRHKILHDEEKNKVQFFCSVCNKGFRQKRYLEQHMQTHCERKPYSCALCNKSFTLNSTLKKHFKTHQNEGYPSLAEFYC